MTTENQYASGIITVFKMGDEYEFLILLQDLGYMGKKNWSFPKGKAEEGEDTLQTALRELEEETGIKDVEILDFPIIDEEYDIHKKDKIKHRVNRYFVGIVKDKEISPKEGEIFDYKWVPFKEAKNLFDFQKETRVKVLEKAKEYLKEYDRTK